MSEEPTSGRKRSTRFSDLEFPLTAIGMVQGMLVAFTAMMFDGGVCYWICIRAIAAYWVMVAWLCFRRGNRLTTGDVFLIRTGFFLWLPVTWMAERAVRSLFFEGI